MNLSPPDEFINDSIQLISVQLKIFTLRIGLNVDRKIVIARGIDGFIFFYSSIVIYPCQPPAVDGINSPAQICTQNAGNINIELNYLEIFGYDASSFQGKKKNRRTILIPIVSTIGEIHFVSEERSSHCTLYFAAGTANRSVMPSITAKSKERNWQNRKKKGRKKKNRKKGGENGEKENALLRFRFNFFF